MENFINLPVEKQTTIIDAALLTFGTNGYKKSSVSDIATAAGISKAMIFHYFGTKKALYFYLVEYCGNLIINEVKEKFDNSVTDFFDRIMLASNIEMSVIKKHPATITFLKNVYFEDNSEVKDDLKSMFAQGEDFRSKIAFEGVDTSKFKEGIDLKLIVKMLMWLTDGFMSSYNNGAAQDFEALCNEFFECMNLMKRNFYKEEAL
ncbi:MAG: transcriptional regulator [Herbinix sp.]|nr:transcriptional regulator [Herbinix sp.]